MAEAFASCEVAHFNLVLGVDDLFDAAWNEGQFVTTSRLPGEPKGGMTELHYTPGARRSVQFGAGYAF